LLTVLNEVIVVLLNGFLSIKNKNKALPSVLFRFRTRAVFRTVRGVMVWGKFLQIDYFFESNDIIWPNVGWCIRIQNIQAVVSFITGAIL